MNLLKRIAAPPDLNTGNAGTILAFNWMRLVSASQAQQHPTCPCFLPGWVPPARKWSPDNHASADWFDPRGPRWGVLQRQKNIVRWYSMMRLSAILGYALTGLIAFLLARTGIGLGGVSGIWALITIPQTILAVTTF